MNRDKTSSTRRAFFLKGSAALGAGVAAAVGAAGLSQDHGAQSTTDQERRLREDLARIADRDAIRNLHVAFTTLIEQQRYEAAAELFTEHAHLDLSGVSADGKAAILRLFADQYRQQAVHPLHTAYRHPASQQPDAFELSEDRLRASANHPIEVELCAPLADDCTAAKMARLQGNVAARYWQSGRFDAQYVKTSGAWKIASLRYVPS